MAALFYFPLAPYRCASGSFHICTLWVC